MVNVTQADRDSAAKLLSDLGLFSNSITEKGVKAFAAHRIAAIEECAKVAKSVGWIPHYVSNLTGYAWEPGSPFDRGAVDARDRIEVAILALKGGNDD